MRHDGWLVTRRPASATNHQPVWVGPIDIASGVGDSGTHIQFADLDGDGRDDYIDIAPDSSATAWHNVPPNGGQVGPGFIPMGQIASGVGDPGSHIQLADLTGDGRAEYLDIADNGSVKAWLNSPPSGGGAVGPVWIPLGQIASGVGDPGNQIQFGRPRWRRPGRVHRRRSGQFCNGVVRRRPQLADRPTPDCRCRCMRHRQPGEARGTCILNWVLDP